MRTESLRIGLIVPSSNTVMEPDLHRRLGAACAISTTRLFLEQVTPEAEGRMLDDELAGALRLLKTTAPGAVVFGCTSAGSLGGGTRDAQIAQLIEQETGSKALTVVASVRDELRAVGARNVAVFTPYQDDLTRSVASCVTDVGSELVKVAGMGLVDNRDIGKVTPEEIVEFVARQMGGVDADCIFLSCTNWRAIDAIEPISTRFHIPVISSNQATIEAARSKG